MPVDEISFEAEEKMERTVDVLKAEFKGIRTGRASPALVEHIKVQYYGAPTPLRQIANISTPDPQLISIRPYAPSALKDIEKAILASELGITPSNDGKAIRLGIPPLSEERRKQLCHHVKRMAEEAKVSIRNVRRDANKHVDKEEDDSVLSEDDAKRAKKEIQDLTDKYEGLVEEALERKTQEIMTV